MGMKKNYEQLVELNEGGSCLNPRDIFTMFQSQLKTVTLLFGWKRRKDNFPSMHLYNRLPRTETSLIRTDQC